MPALNSTSAGAKHNKSLKIVFVITATYLLIEVVVGFISNSLALLSDAAHMLTDVGGQALALFAIWMASKPRNNRKTYGYYRVEILSALTNALVLVFISGYILFEAWQRFKNPPAVAGIPMLIVAFCGLIINLIGMKVLSAGSKESINIKGAFLEVVSDMLSSVGVIIAGIVILATGWLYIDPVMSALIGLFILPRTFRLLKESVDILLEAVPANINYVAVEKCITERPGVQAMHDLHIWTITSGVNALSVHVIMKDETNFAEIGDLVRNIKEHLASEFNITHTTIEVHEGNKNYLQNIV
jgi:cobalt-zinc-cadmium efflux system protein